MIATPAPYRFIAYEVSYFSAKVRPALRYKQLWYEELRNDFTEIKQRTGMDFIPVVVTPDGETWQDSSEIYDRLEERHPDPPLIPRSPVQRIASLLVELYTDEFALLPAMHYRWGSEIGESSARARFTAMIGSAEIGKLAAERMAKARLLLGATDETAPAIEAHTRELLDALSAHFEHHSYLLGGRQSLADCALMGPLYGHLFNDLVSRRLLLGTAVPVVGWIERTNFPNTDSQGDWLEDDALAPSFVDVLRVMGRDAAPMILAMVRNIESWADTRPADTNEPPRRIGTTDSSLRGTPIQRMTQPYTLWMIQRTLDVYRGLEENERQQVDAAMAGTGWEAVLAYEPRHRLGKRSFKLHFEPLDGR